MKNYFKHCALLFFTLSPLIAKADTQLGLQSIIEVSTGWGGEGVYITTVEGFTAEGCGPKAFLQPSHAMYKEIYALLLSSMLTGNQVKLYVSGCAGTSMVVLAAAVQ